MNKLLKGNEVVAYAISLCQVDVIPTFPITPQTTIIDKIAMLINQKQFNPNVQYLHMESEYSVMGACIGAANMGARTFTATAGQGLLYMHELIHFAAGSRLPIVMAVVNRSIAPGWNILSDQNDSLSQRDTGWLQVYVADHQELYDHILLSYFIAEKYMLPIMIIQDGFLLSHTNSTIELSTTETFNTFHPKKNNLPHQVDFQHPHHIGSLMSSQVYSTHRENLHSSILQVEQDLENIYHHFNQHFGRHYNPIESIGNSEALLKIIVAGAFFALAPKWEKQSQSHNISMEIIQIRWIRPSTHQRLKQKLQKATHVIVLNKNCSFGSGGILTQEIMPALNQETQSILSLITGIGGMELDDQQFWTIVHQFLSASFSGLQEQWQGASL